MIGWFERFCPVYTPRGERLHVFSQHARFLGSSYILPNFRFARRWPKETPPHFLPQHAPSLNNHSSTTLQPQPNQPQPPFIRFSTVVRPPSAAPTIGNRSSTTRQLLSKHTSTVSHLPRSARPTESSANHANHIGRTSARLSATSTPIQPLHNRFPTPHQPSETSTPSTTVLQPPRNREPITATPHLHYNHIPAARSRQTDDSALGKHPRLNHPSCRSQERFRHNHPTAE